MIWSNESLPQGEKEFAGIRIARTGDVTTVSIPFPCVQGLFYRVSPSGLAISTDLRELIDQTCHLDPAGVASLLTFGACVPPITPYAEIKSFVPGFSYECQLATAAVRVVGGSDFRRTISDRSDGEDLSDLLLNQIRSASRTTPPVVLFSGGVDSGVIASIGSAAGLEPKLIHCSFGSHDAETENAKAIADELGMAMEVIHFSASEGLEALENAGALFPFPFCDASTAPTHSLTKQLAERVENGSVVLDGTGADGSFGLFGAAARSRVLYRSPRFVRKLASEAYRFFRMYRHTGVPESVFRVVRRSVLFDELPSAVAQNPLLDILYKSSADSLSQVMSSCATWIGRLHDGTDPLINVPLLDIGLVCGHIFAQKNRTPLLSNRFMPVYPFLSPQIVHYAMTHAQRLASLGTKAELKSLLAKRVSRRLIYRPKRGFVGQTKQQFAHDVFLSHLRAAVQPDALLFEFLLPKAVLALVDRVAAGKCLPFQTYNALWAIAFTNTWLSQAPLCGTPAAATSPVRASGSSPVAGGMGISRK